MIDPPPTVRCWRCLIALIVVAGCGGSPRDDAALDRRYAQAEQAYADRRGAEAAAEYRALAALAHRGGDRELEALAWYRLGRLSEGAADHPIDREAAAHRYERAVATGAYERGAMAALARARLLHPAGGAAWAAALVELATAYPESAAADEAARSLARALPPREAASILSALEASVEGTGLADDVAFERAEVQATRLKDLDGALSTLQGALERWPDGPLVDDCRWAIGAIHRARGAWAEAAAIYDAMVAYAAAQDYLIGAHRPRRLNDGAWLAGAIRAERLDDCPGAIQAWRRALALLPTSTLRDDLWLAMARCHHALGAAGEAQADLTRLLAERPESRFAAAAQAALAGGDLAALPRPAPTPIQAEISEAGLR